MKLNIKQAKRLMQILNGLNEASVEQFIERDKVVAQLEEVDGIKRYKEVFQEKAKEVVDNYNEALKVPFAEMQEDIKKIDEMDKVAKSNKEKGKLNDKRSNLMVQYNAKVTEIKKVYDVKLKEVEEEVLKELEGECVVELPMWLKITDNDYHLFFKAE